LELYTFHVMSIVIAKIFMIAWSPDISLPSILQKSMRVTLRRAVT